MPHNNYFQFKQFKITQEKSAMRVGTDGILLGAWTAISGAQNILDIGTGTGLIALMLAQRSEASVTGVEIDSEAATEAQLNVRNSPWSGRVKIHNKSFQQFADENSVRFDLIVSNPPFFIEGLPAQNQARNMARHSVKLNLQSLVHGALKCLVPSGRICVILPVVQAEKLITYCSECGLQLFHLTRVLPKKGAAPNRYLMEFGQGVKTVQKDALAIKNENGTDDSEPFKNLTASYYLNF